MTAYAEFLETKRRTVTDAGRVAEPSEVHPSLFDFQRDITLWALRKGRAAMFCDTGLGKSRMQLEWARMSGDCALLVAPLSVARQTVREAAQIDSEVRYVRDPAQVTGPGMWITNYEMVDHFDPSVFDAVVLDESSILKNVAGKMRERITTRFRHTPAKLCCTATPAPNDVAELCNHAEFLGMMSRAEMLASFFVHDDDGWRLKGHASEPMYRWLATWATAIRRPSDLGYPDDAYALPPLNIISQVLKVNIDADGQLFATELGGVGGRARIRRKTIDARVDRAVELAKEDEQQWIVWCGMNDEARAVASMVDGAVNVEGSWTPEAKASALEAFQDGKVRVLVTKPSIAGFGMNFQNCSRMAFLGLSDSYEAYYQAIRRCYRFGQTEPVQAHIIVSELEAAIVANVKAKEVEASKLTDALVRHVAVTE